MKQFELYRGAHAQGGVTSLIESFWGRMQTELLNRKRWNTRIELANAIFGYLEIFHNRAGSGFAVGDGHPQGGGDQCGGLAGVDGQPTTRREEVSSPTAQYTVPS